MLMRNFQLDFDPVGSYARPDILLDIYTPSDPINVLTEGTIH
jgi:hypothetical protein